MLHRWWISLIAFAAVISGCVVFSGIASAATSYVVTNCSGSVIDTGSLPYAVSQANANGGGDITFSVNCTSSTPILPASSTPMVISNPGTYTITGNGQANTVIDGNGATTIFSLSGNGVSVTLVGLGIQHGLTTSTTVGSSITVGVGASVSVVSSAITQQASSSSGAAIVNSGTLNLQSSSVSSNSTRGRAGSVIFNDGRVELVNSTFNGNSTCCLGNLQNSSNGYMSIDRSTFSSNSTSNNGGAIYNQGQLVIYSSTFWQNTATTGAAILSSGGSVSITSSTVLNNSTTGTGGGGIKKTGGTISLLGDIVAGSSALSGNCQGTMTDLGYNISDDSTCGFTATGSVNSSPTLDASLGTLASNGGPTQTILPALGSPAIGAIPFGTTVGSIQICGLPDQRGYSVSSPSPCDIGAVQTQGSQYTPAALTITAASDTKTYDGTTSSNGVPTLTSGALLQSDGQNTDHLDCTQAFNSANVLTATSTVATCVIRNGAGTGSSGADVSSNYSISYVDGTGTITRASLTITAASDTKTYDGTTSSNGVPTLTSGALLQSDGQNTDHLDCTQAFNSANVLTATSTVATCVIRNGAGTGSSGADVSSNYSISYVDGTGTITRASANVTVNPYSASYNGNPHIATYTIAGVNGETGSTVGTIDVSSTSHINAGTYQDPWSFTGTGNYGAQAGAVADVIQGVNISTSIISSHGKASGQISCSRTCSGTWTLTTTKKIVIGSVRFTHSGQWLIVLNAKGKALLRKAKHHSLNAIAKIAIKHGKTYIQHVTVTGK